MSHPTSVFSAEISGFNAAHKLSPRESEIVQSLIQNITNSEDIAKALGISTHTVNNHLKSIFEKTSTKSKTEILSSFLRYAADQLKSENLFVRRPRVLVVSTRQPYADTLASQLMDLGLQAHVAKGPQSVKSSISLHGCDLVLIDTLSPELNSIEILQEIRQCYRSWPYIVILGSMPGMGIEECMHHGASGLVQDLDDIDTLFKSIMTILPSDRQATPPSETKPVESFKLGAGAVAVDQSDVGFGGVFITLEPNIMQRKSVQVGAIIDVRLSLQDVPSPIQVRGEIVWKRSEAAKDQKTGIGLRFVRMGHADQIAFHKYLELYPVQSFIPSGEDTLAVEERVLVLQNQ